MSASHVVIVGVFRHVQNMLDCQRLLLTALRYLDAVPDTRNGRERVEIRRLGRL
ncbi:hypothetical protein SAMN04488498_12750 [Mesorhizobium albiziae]|uniref:Uncharacterized protein n=1 Tax=Neomesorhizobium albiziae TaxID=335020 RepID=A0A1I4ENV0_9HYPH|nr:hypothetical protein [Mesorhizobium albiziae]GLS34404.1 hypothetical protein GCM10007937_61190 [Mesorhizobium albiziae]SFL06187.1 hypothetical protein SAMN04488498_12750 [Mesorhizobium albiziae]